MLKDLTLHGGIGPVDFLVFAAGANISNLYFYQEEGSQIRFFSRGNELTLSQDSVSYKGTGGSFCEYMFGVEKPFKDLVKKEVHNRLVMFGAYLDEDETLIFSNDTEGSESFSRLFMLGHAVNNYYFIISSDHRDEPRKRQKQVLQTVGKLLKRADLIARDRDAELAESFVTSLNEPGSTVFVFKLIHRANREFYRAFKSRYSGNRILTKEDAAAVNGLAARHGIDFYQQERMKIDVMYRHPDNKGVVDEYRDILLRVTRKDSIEQTELARLHRLRTLSIRNSIPGVLFDTLDDFLLQDKRVQAIDEPEYLKESRAILENLFFKDSSLKRHIITEDILKLLRAKHTASARNDIGFENILLNTGRACDEYARETNDFSIFEEFSSIITYFDRYDTVRASMSRLAFMDSVELTDNLLRSLIGNKKEFDSLDKGLFMELFVKDLLTNKYMNAFGKKKIRTLADGIEQVVRGDASLKDILAALRAIVEEERSYKLIRSALKEKVRDFYSPIDMKDGKDGLARVRQEIQQQMRESGIAAVIPEAVFDRALLDLKTESYYLNHLLPTILQTGDLNLREDFLTNSGLDRFYIEDLEKEFFREKGFDATIIQTLKDNGVPTEVGGGERIRTAG